MIRLHAVRHQSPARLLLLGLGTLLGSTLLLAPPPAAYAGYGTCSGSVTTIDGTDGDDVITGTEGDDVIYTGPGNDTVYGLGGNDIICTWTGDDVVYGGPGNDKLYGDPGDDQLYGEDGNDTLVGDSGNDLLDGGAGNDTIYSNRGDDVARGGPGDDKLYAMAGSDDLDGGTGSDYCDAAYFSPRYDRFSGCETVDAILFTSADTFVRDGGYATVNYGRDSVLETKQSTPGYTRRTLLRFDLRDIPGTLTRARLQLSPIAQGQPSIRQQVALVTSGWSESSVTWATQPTVGAVITTWTQRSTPQKVDITGAAQAAWTGTRQLDLAVDAAESGRDAWLQYASADAGNTATRPALVVRLVVP